MLDAAVSSECTAGKAEDAAKDTADVSYLGSGKLAKHGSLLLSVDLWSSAKPMPFIIVHDNKNFNKKCEKVMPKWVNLCAVSWPVTPGLCFL